MKKVPRFLVVLVWLSLVLWVGHPAVAQRPDSPQELLQRGLFEEEANRDLDKATVAYEGVIRAFDVERQYAGTAIFRLAEVKAKQGKKDEAIALFQRVATEFATVEPLAKPARERLAALGAGGGVVTSAAAGDVTRAEADEIERLRELVKNSPDLLNAATEGVAPLAKAAKEGWLKAAAFLLDNGADVNGTGTRLPALHLAASYGRKAMTEFLVERKADVNRLDQAFRTPLYIAVKERRFEVARALLKAGASPGILSRDMTNAQRRAPLHVAAENNDLKMISLLLDHGAKIDAFGGGESEGVTALMLASGEPVVKLLLERGANPNARSPKGPSALRRAVTKPRVEYVKMLLEKGADAKETCLVNDAVDAKSSEIVKLLAQAGASLDTVRPENQLAPLHVTVLNSLELTRTLLELGAKPDVRTKDATESTPLHLCIQYSEFQSSTVPGLQAVNGLRVIQPGAGDEDPAMPKLDPFAIMQVLVEHGADVNARAARGLTPLHLALRSPSVPMEIIEWLLAKGADRELVDAEGLNPLMSANPDQRILLEERISVTKAMRPDSIRGWVRLKDQMDDTLVEIKQAAEFDLAPSLPEALAELFGGKTKGLGSLKVLVYRSASDGKVSRVAEVQIDLQSQLTNPPSIAWGDFLVMTHGATMHYSGTLPDWKRRSAPETRTKISIQLGDRRQEVTLMPWDHPLMWEPGEGEVPYWRLSELVQHAVEAESRADLAKVQVRRVVDGKPLEWTVDLRPAVPGQGVRSVPARLAAGDEVIVPLAPFAKDNVAERRSRIYRAAPGRIFGETVFRLRPKDDAPRTLGDLLAESYATSVMVVPRPDLTAIRIHRLKADNSGEETLTVNFQVVAETGRTAPDAELAKLDTALEWGDIVEIDSRKDGDTRVWAGLDGNVQFRLKQMLRRKIYWPKVGVPGVETATLEPRFAEYNRVLANQSTFAQWQVRLRERSPFRASESIPPGKNLLRVTIRSGDHEKPRIREFTAEEFSQLDPWLVDGDIITMERF